MADNAMSLPQSFVPALRYQVHKYVSWPLHELQNRMENLCLSFMRLVPFFEGNTGVQSWRRGNRFLGEWTCPVASSTAYSPVRFPPSIQVARRMLPHSGYTQPARRTPGEWGFTDHDLHFIAPFEQNKMSLPCTAILQRAALKSKIMCKKPHPPRPFLPCLNETSN